MITYILKYSLCCSFLHSYGARKFPGIVLHSSCQFINTCSNALLDLANSKICRIAHTRYCGMLCSTSYFAHSLLRLSIFEHQALGHTCNRCGLTYATKLSSYSICIYDCKGVTTCLFRIASHMIHGLTLIVRTCSYLCETVIKAAIAELLCKNLVFRTCRCLRYRRCFFDRINELRLPDLVQFIEICAHLVFLYITSYASNYL